MNQVRARLAGTGTSVPERVIDNHRLSRVLDTNDRWIQERSGIATRHYAEKGVSSADLGAEAARAALADAGWEPSDVDYLVCATMTPDHYFPGCGTLIQQRLGVEPIPALDIRQQCAGFAYGLQVVDALIRSGTARRVLLVGTDNHSSLMPFSDATWRVLEGEDDGPVNADDFEHNSRYRHLVVLFGDAAGAMAFEGHPLEAEEGSDEERGILASALYGDGERLDILYVPGGGSASRPFITADMVEAGGTVPSMDGKAVFKLAVTRMPEATRGVLEKGGYGLDDLDLLIMHQANLRINEAAQKFLGLPDDKVHNNIQRYGNTTSATLPLAFHEARLEGKAPPGTLVAFTVLGAGLHWGSVLMRV